MAEADDALGEAGQQEHREDEAEGERTMRQTLNCRRLARNLENIEPAFG